LKKSCQPGSKSPRANFIFCGTGVLLSFPIGLS
jgi:hypothetical protein